METLVREEPKEYKEHQNAVKTVLSNVASLIKSMVILEDEVEDDSIEVAIEETIKNNPELAGELGKTGEELSKIKYKELENKLEGIKAKVSEEQANIQTQTSERQKGGKQITRVDED